MELLRWETHALPGAGRPQEVITRAIGDYDVFVGVMWRRFGTPTGRAGSGTEEEFENAYKTWFMHGRPRILFYFSLAPYYSETEAEHRQVGRVLRFRRKYSKAVLFWNYKTLDDFTSFVRSHLRRTIAEVLEQRPLDADDIEFARRTELDARNITQYKLVPNRWY